MSRWIDVLDVLIDGQKKKMRDCLFACTLCVLLQVALVLYLLVSSSPDPPLYLAHLVLSGTASERPTPLSCLTWVKGVIPLRALELVLALFQAKEVLLGI